jgi:hypothetical protein
VQRSSALQEDRDRNLDPLLSAYKRALKSNDSNLASQASREKFSEKGTSMIQARVTCEDGIRAIDGDGAPRKDVQTQFENVDEKERFDLVAQDGTRATVLMQLECKKASSEFWKGIVGKVVQLDVSKDDMERISKNEMVTKVVLLPMADNGFGSPQVLVSNRVDPGIDIRVEAKRRGQPILSMVLTRTILQPVTENQN